MSFSLYGVCLCIMLYIRKSTIKNGCAIYKSSIESERQTDTFLITYLTVCLKQKKFFFLVMIAVVGYFEIAFAVVIDVVSSVHAVIVFNVVGIAVAITDVAIVGIGLVSLFLSSV